MSLDPEMQLAALKAMARVRSNMLTDFHKLCDRAVIEAMDASPKGRVTVDQIIPDRGELVAVIEPYFTQAAHMMKPAERADRLADAMMRLLKTNLEKGIAPGFRAESKAGVASDLGKASVS